MFWTSEVFRLLSLCCEKAFRALLAENGRRMPLQPDRGSLALREGPRKLCLYATACLWEPTSRRARISCGVPGDRQGEISHYIFCMSGACAPHAPAFRASEGVKGPKTFHHILRTNESDLWYAHSDLYACISGELPGNKHGKKVS